MGGRGDAPGAFFFPCAGLPRRFGAGFIVGSTENIANQVYTRQIKLEESQILPCGSATFTLLFRDAGSFDLELPTCIFKA
jgi:hypothetical protein